MQVPALDGTSEQGDFECGYIASLLFQEAVQSGALAAPDGVHIECYPDRDISTGGFVLVAYPDGKTSSYGVTTGYKKADRIGVEAGFDTNDPKAVTKALDLFAHELNSALAGLEQATKQTRHRANRRQRSALSPVANQSPGATVGDRESPLSPAVTDGSKCEQLIPRQATDAPVGKPLGRVLRRVLASLGAGHRG
jgi:hypothetical protein